MSSPKLYAAWKARRDAAIQAYGGKCVQCGATAPLAFDHIDPRTKVFEPSACFWSDAPEYAAELERCQLLCGPCHALKTARENSVRRGGYKCGTASSYYAKKCRCDACRIAVREYKLKLRLRKGLGPPRPVGPRAEHGSHSKYSHGCRCDPCRAGHREYQRQWYKK